MDVRWQGKKAVAGECEKSEIIDQKEDEMVLACTKGAKESRALELAGLL